eukprot:TRINITY_DN12355_c0_g1_i1.p1 TRINITY_DN12355_c0_g1~~TRINITY_DN12355_c0_g1_i1.p1  ORF type:complete len:268 (+),score=52.32 TRINITY_DN12355_c0_g1_i1:71-874(+)
MEDLRSRYLEGGEERLHSDLVIAYSVFFAPALLVSGFIGNYPYGKFVSGAKAFMQWTMPTQIAWIVMEVPAFLLIVINFLFFSDAAHQSSLLYRICFLMFAGHYLNRSFIYPFTLKKGEFNGTIAFIGALYNIVSGYIQGAFISRLGPLPEDSGVNLRLIIGMAIFGLGVFVNWHSDMLLGRLRKPGETGYKIPHGGMFNFVTAANYSGELIEWIGYAITMNGSAGYLWAWMSFCYFVPRAHATHEWYLRKFEDYPKKRKKLIPLIW